MKLLTWSSSAYTVQYPGEAVEEPVVIIYGQHRFYSHDTDISLKGGGDVGLDLSLTRTAWLTNSTESVTAYEYDGSYVRRDKADLLPQCLLTAVGNKTYTVGSLQDGVSVDGATVTTSTNFTNATLSIPVTYNESGYKETLTVDSMRDASVMYSVISGPPENTLRDFYQTWFSNNVSLTTNTMFTYPDYSDSLEFGTAIVPSNYVRNALFEFAELDLSCVSIWNDSSGSQNGRGKMCTLISPSFALAINHRSLDYYVPIGGKFAFLGNDDEVYIATVKTNTFAESPYDLTIIEFEDPLPSMVKPALLTTNIWNKAGDLSGFLFLNIGQYRETRLCMGYHVSLSWAEKYVSYSGYSAEWAAFIDDEFSIDNAFAFTNSASTQPVTPNWAIPGDSSGPIVLPAPNGTNVVLMSLAATSGSLGVSRFDGSVPTGIAGSSWPTAYTNLIDLVETTVAAGGESASYEDYTGFPDLLPWRNVDWTITEVGINSEYEMR